MVQRAAIERRGDWYLLALVSAAVLVLTWITLTTTERDFVLVPREQWDPEPTQPYTVPEQTIRRIVIHHDAVEYGAGSTGEEKMTALLHSSRRYSGWPDIPYHYLIDRDGRVFAGRPEHLRCETHGRYDASDTLHIALLGNYSQLQPSELQLAALRALVREKAAKYGLSADAIKPHSAVMATDCPGMHTRERLASMRWW